MKHYLKFILVLLLAIGVCGPVEATLLGSWTQSVGIGSSTPFSTFDLDIQLVPTSGTTAVLFDSLSISAVDNGLETFATSSAGPMPDPGFNDFLNLITNGVDDNVRIAMSAPPAGFGYSSPESLAFGTSPDFQSQSIGAFGLFIDDLEFLSGSLSGPVLNGTNVNFTLTLSVYDSIPAPVPIPATILLLGTGLVSLVGFEKKKFFKK
jgi:hypothetical protein